MSKVYRSGSWAESGRVLPGRRICPKAIDQILEGGRVVCVDHDQKFSQKEIVSLLEGCFADCVVKDGRLWLLDREGVKPKVCFYTRNINHLGGDWSSEKKRIQIGTEFPALYRKNLADGVETVLLGVYHYYPDGLNGVVLFVCFSASTYAARSTNNSAAHVHTVDLINAYKRGVYRRLDKSGNEILVLNRSNFVKHINSLRGSEEVDVVRKDREVLAYLGRMFDLMPREFLGIECFKEMMAAKDKTRMNQGAWEGWYYEFYFRKYLKDNPTEDIIWWSKKEAGELDFDLKFPYAEWFYGDVKSDAHKKSIQGNLKSNVDFLVTEKSGRLWYVALDFTPEKDADHGYETTLWWNRQLGKTDKPMSYAKRMKYSIHVNRMDVYEITQDTIPFLKVYTPSPCSGKDRRPKYRIPDKMKEYLRIYQRT